MAGSYSFVNPAVALWVGVALGGEVLTGWVYLAMPLVLAALGLLLYGAPLTALGLATNFLLLLAILLMSGPIPRLLGPAALRALSKLVMIFLAAIAVYFIRTGIMGAVRG